MLVRSADDRDLPQLRAIYHDSRARCFWWMDPACIRADDFDRDTAGEAIWVAEAEAGAVAGFISVWMPEHFIHGLFVAPDLMRHGYGLALLNHCLGNIGRPARLKCSTHNDRALGLYRSQGWVVLTEGRGPDGPYYELQFDR